MKHVLPILVILFCSAANAQNPGAQAPSRAAIEGIVTKDPGSEPVKKAVIELIAENQAEGGDYTALTAADGSFRIENILPGRYHLFAERSGFLDADKNRGHSEGRILTLSAGQELTQLHMRLQAAAVIRGRVTDEDGDPMPDAEVTVLRQTFAGGHTHWEQVGAERTNDLGEYRVANLAAGNVYVSVSPAPDFRSLIEGSGAAPHASGPEKAATSYQTTYYPGTGDRGQAAPVQLRPGDDFPIDFSLVRAPSLSIRGTVVNLPPHTTASIMLQSRDFNLVLNGAEMQKNGNFIIRDVAPGSYTIVATVDGSPVPMTARQSLQLSSSNVDGLRLAPQPGATIRGQLRLEGRSGQSRIDPSQIFLSLQSIDGEQEGALTVAENFPNLAHVGGDGSFQFVDVPAGDYYVQMATRENIANDEWYVKSVLAGGRDVNDSVISINGGTVVFDVVASANGGVVDGVVANSKGQPLANAVVVAVPNVRRRGRVDRFRQTVSDQSGHFMLHGIRPGDYTLLSWESVDGDAYYNPEFLKAYEGQGTPLQITDGDRKTVQLQAIPDATSTE